MRRSLAIAIVTLIVMIAVYCLRVAALPGSDIDKLPKKYRYLGEMCREKESFNCCMSSARTIAQGGYQLAENPEDLTPNACPLGYQRNLLRCIDSLVWCEPVQK